MSRDATRAIATFPYDVGVPGHCIGTGPRSSPITFVVGQDMCPDSEPCVRTPEFTIVPGDEVSKSPVALHVHFLRKADLLPTSITFPLKIPLKSLPAN